MLGKHVSMIFQGSWFEIDAMYNVYPVTCSELTTFRSIYQCANFAYDDVANDWLCLKCNTGRTGLSDAGSLQDCLTEIDDCDSVLSFSGLYRDPEGADLLDLEAYASCTKCFNDKLPVLFLRASADQLLLAPFDESLLIPHDAALDVPTGQTSQCLLRTAEAFSLDPQAVFTSVPLNCGFVLYLTSLEKSADIANLPSIICYACLPGYSKVMTGVYISACEAIANCD